MIHMSRTLKGAVAAIHSFRGYMKQMIFDSSYLLRPATFLEDIKGSLFNHSNIFVIERIAITYSLK